MDWDPRPTLPGNRRREKRRNERITSQRKTKAAKRRKSEGRWAVRGRETDRIRVFFWSFAQVTFGPGFGGE
jgi:hypothetical protein